MPTPSGMRNTSRASVPEARVLSVRLAASYTNRLLRSASITSQARARIASSCESRPAAAASDLEASSSDVSSRTFWFSASNRRAFSSAIAAWAENAARRFSSAWLKGPPRLFTTSATATTRPARLDHPPPAG